MIINNTSKLLIDYIKWLEFSTIYKEPSTPFAIEGNVHLPQTVAASFLKASATAGNKVTGFFQKQPELFSQSPVRGICIFVSFELPEKILYPTMFCRKADDIPALFPLAVKLSADMSMPVSVIISSNAVNNYTGSEMPVEKLNRTSPYIGKEIPKWNRQAYREKLQYGFNAVKEQVKIIPLGDNISFNDPDADFPVFITPEYVTDMGIYFSENKSITCGKNEQKILENILIDICGSNIPEITIITGNDDCRTVAETANECSMLLCPGCPVEQIYANNDLINTTVFSSINCPAIDRLHKPLKTSFEEYAGLINKKTGLKTIFIGNLSDINQSMCKELQQISEDSLVVALNDTGEQTQMMPVKKPCKAVITKNTVFPYSCNNIHTIGKIKFNQKKCTCIKESKLPVCIDKGLCAAICREADYVYIDKNICNGCARCISLCPQGALS